MDCNLHGMPTAFKAAGSGLRRKFRELQTKCQVVYTKVPTGLTEVVCMTKRTIALDEQIWENDYELQKIQRE